MVPNRISSPSATDATIGKAALHERSSPSLTLFGAPAVESEGQTAALPFERRGQLVAYLAMKHGWVGRAELAALLWPDLSSKLAYTNLRKTLFRLQGAAWSPAITSEGGALRVDVGTDVAAFERALADGRLADAIALRQGEFLTGFDDDANEAWSSWLSFERERLRVGWRGAVLSRLEEAIEAVEGIDLSGRLLASDPLDEAALRAHLAWLARAGQSARARQAYREFAARLSKDLGLSPSADLAAFQDGLSAGVPRPEPPPAVPDPEFVGRTVELRRMRDLLVQGDCRLLTLAGPGGAGKTRLAQRARRDLADEFADGSVFVRLEGSQGPADLVSRLARELGVRQAGKRDLVEDIEAFLRERRMLVVLDNFEEIAAHAAIVERLLSAAPGLRAIVTSRVRLATASEWLLPLEGLPFPDAEDRDHLEAFDAVRLFVQAARRVEPALVPSVEALAIVDICRQVEGMPLALEVAASWTRVLSCDAIATELRRGTELLQSVDPARPARHASMEVVFDQSWRLLTTVERDALARLSVFRGGFSPEAARTVAAASPPVLGALADKSLLRKAAARLHMHPLVAQLAARRLPEGDGTPQAHARYFLRLLAQSVRKVEHGDGATLAAIETEFENCRAAWRFAVATESADFLTSAAPTITSFLEHRGRLAEGAALFEEALAAPFVAGSAPLRALLLGQLGQMHFRRDAYADGMEVGAQALEAAKQARDPKLRGFALQVVGLCSMRLGLNEDAKRYLEEGLRAAMAASDMRRVTAIMHNLALVAKLMGNGDEALRRFLEALAQARKTGDVGGEALMLANIGILYGERGDNASAMAQLRAGLAISEAHGNVATRGLILANLTAGSIRMRDFAAAERYANSAIELAHATGNTYIACYMNMQFARIALAHGDVPGARARLHQAMQVAVTLLRPAVVFEGVFCFAELLAATGAQDCARAVLAFVAAHPLANAPIREEARRQREAWPAPARDLDWPGIGLDELANRIVDETELAYAPLIAALRG
jgi:predicted ATPase/DNA-binding SARP family transcriptional activator/Tfp pilus assembly protein PilF